ncbi:MAG: Eco57I restriction-modification methylase domain-containing protein, partial [Chloroflexota bacterium]|nr:Eco57I restriction-modification methylase domain-containing protein [Chloroflexota bacterium]
KIDPALWQPLADHATGKSIAAPAKFNDWLSAAGALSEQHRFFHWELEFPEVYFDHEGQSLGNRAGFDAVVGNPPYVRQEQVAALKPYLASAHRAVYDGVADLYVYFYHQGLELLRTGGRLSYIVTNKWLRAGYGEPLRGYFAGAATIERIVDFGHAPIFEDADTFPSIVVLSKRAAAPQEDGSGQTLITLFPREALNQVEIASYIDSHNYVVPSHRFDAKPWSLERPEVDALMARIRESGIPLREFLGQAPAYGIKTGLNEAFLIDTPTKERLIQEDPRSAEIIKPYLHGQDIKRWTPAWAGLWMIFARRGIDIDSTIFAVLRGTTPRDGQSGSARRRQR